MSKTRRRVPVRTLLVSLLLGLAASMPASAQDDKQRAGASYPTRPVRLIVPFPPGAINDFIARAVGGRLTDFWGQQVIVDNRPGAGLVIGTELAARAPADGHTLILLSTNHTMNRSVYAKLPFDLLKDFAPLTIVGASPFLLVVNAPLPAKSLRELLDLARAKPGQVAYGSSGTGGAPHLMGEMLTQMAGVRFLHVPYKGGAPMILDVMGGQLQFTFQTYNSTRPHITAGRLRPLAVTGAKRSPSLPELPSIAEQGYPDYDANPWWGFGVPAGTPRPLVARLNVDIVRAINMPDLKERLSASGLQIVGSTPEQMTAVMREEVDRWSKVVKAANIKPD